MLVVDITSANAAHSRLGRYKVTERRSDGSLVLAPESVDEVIAETAGHRSAATSSSRLSTASARRLLSRLADGAHIRAGHCFSREFSRLSREQDREFRKAVAKLVAALKQGREPPRSLRIKRVQGTRDVWEISTQRRPRDVPLRRRVEVRRDTHRLVARRRPRDPLPTQ